MPDGYPRALGNIADVAFAGRRAPLAGRVSMDLITVDITDLPAETVIPGDWAELFGQNITLDEIAACAGTIGYELLTGLGPRCERVYLD